MLKLKGITPFLKTTDLQRSIDFYIHTLGFAIDAVWPADKPTLCFLYQGDVEIGFYLDTEKNEVDPTLTGQLRIEVEDVMSLHAKIAGKVETLWGPEVYFYGRREFAIKDCNGYLLSFSEPTDDAPTCPPD